MSKQKHSILALVPPNKEGALVLKEALFFQKTLGMKLFIINIVKTPSFYLRNFKAEKVKRHLDNAKEELIDFVQNTIQDEIPNDIVISVKTGEVVTVLTNESKRGGHEFILIDKSKCSYSGALCKNKIDDVVSQSKCPVLTVNKEVGVAKIKNICIPIDISQSTEKRLLWATLFAQKYDAKITILSALNTNMDIKKSLAYKNARKIQHMLWQHDVDCDVKVLNTQKQDKYKVILDHIKKEKPEMVIIRTHQDSFFADTCIGKFVSGIVHGCDIPVFTVNYTPHSLKYLFS